MRIVTNFLKTLFVLLITGLAATAQPTISGVPYCCKGQTSRLSTVSRTPGSWSSSNPDVASVNSRNGKVTGVSDGVAVITFTYDKGSVTVPFTVYSTANPGKITGNDNISIGSKVKLTNAESANKMHSWSSSMPEIAVINATTGEVTGISAGAATITCATDACGPVVQATKNIYVNATDCISGHINFGGGFKGKLKVTLLHYDQKLGGLMAADSALLTCTDSSVFYHFAGLPTDSFRLKAQVCDTITYRYGFLSTFYPSNTYWYNGNLIYHMAGTQDLNRDIMMIYGRFEH
jgi:Bacterial Ig-like domain (group 2)